MSAAGQAWKSFRFLFRNHFLDTTLEIEVERTDFVASMIKAQMAYACANGGQATHLVLGKLETAKFDALIQYEKMEGRLVWGATGQPRQFHGMTILVGPEESMCIAAEEEK